MFFREPVGKYVVQVCRTLSCALRGAERVTAELERTLGIKVGETDPTGTFTLMEMECLGACDRAPVVMVNNDALARVPVAGGCRAAARGAEGRGRGGAHRMPL